MANFGYQPGDGTTIDPINGDSYGSGSSFNGTKYVNDTGSTVYTNTIRFFNVHTTIAGSFQVALYSNHGSPNIDQPFTLEATSNTLSHVDAGVSNDFTLDKTVAIRPGESCWVFLRSNVNFRLDGSQALQRLVSCPQQNPFPNPMTNTVLGDRILAFTIVDGASHSSGNIRSSFVFAESLQEGLSTKLLNSFTLMETLTESVRSLLMPFLFVESLHPVDVEEFMSTIPFPGFGNSDIDPTVPAALDPAHTKLPGLAFNVHKKPGFKTRISESASGLEIRNALMMYPRWTYELTYEFLEDRTGAESSLKTILGFFLEMLGSFDSWLFKDPDDYIVVAGIQAETDGVTTEFPLVRSIGNYSERIGQVDSDNAINFYLDGGLVDPADYTLVMPNRLVFTTAPTTGQILTADFQYFFVCRFLEDEQDYEKFADKLWALQTCEFRSLVA